jgi:GTPase Era involved in 16S rRNA processing
MTSEHSYKFRTSAELLFEQCLTSAPSAGFVVTESNREARLINLADEIVHGISLEVHVKDLDSSSRLVVRTSGSMAIIGQPRRMQLISAIKRGLRN